MSLYRIPGSFDEHTPDGPENTKAAQILHVLKEKNIRHEIKATGIVVDVKKNDMETIQKLCEEYGFSLEKLQLKPGEFYFWGTEATKNRFSERSAPVQSPGRKIR